MYYALMKNPEKTLSNLVKNTKKHFKNIEKDKVVVGISGGIDSAVAAAICGEAGITVIGRSLPLSTNTKEEILRAKKIGKFFCHDFSEIYPLQIYLKFSEEISLHEGFCNDKTEDTKMEKIRRGNIKARIRMIYLYHVAHLNSGIVLSTDNFTEYMLGFWTLHGDVGDFGPLQQLWKTEVYMVAELLVKRYLDAGNKQKANSLALCIEAVPTDGLGVSNTDMDQIGAKSYEEVDEILIEWMYNRPDTLKSHPVILRHTTSLYKRNNPQIINRISMI